MSKKSKNHSKSSGHSKNKIYAKGTDGDDVLEGGDYNDYLKGEAGNDTLIGNAGNDKLKGGDGDDVLLGGDGKDYLKGGDGNDLLDGGAGKDKLKGGDGDDVLLGGDGKDYLKGDDGNDQLDGGSGDDKLKGGDGDDVLLGGDGDDYLKGDKGNDYLDGGVGEDKLKGGKGDDVLLGGDGDDYLKGDKGNDQLDGGAGDDKLKGGSGDDVLNGGAGNDKVDGDSGDDLAIFNVSENAGFHNEYDGGQGCDTLLLEMTSEEWFRDDIQADIAEYLAYLDAKAGHGFGKYISKHGKDKDHHKYKYGKTNGDKFYFESLDLEVRKFEKLKVTVDGVELDPRDEPVDAVDDSYTTEFEDSIITGNVLDNDSVPDLVRSVELVDDVATGVLAFNDDGSFSYDPGNAFDYLAAGESAEVTFTYKVIDADYDEDTATVTITITGTNDAPVVAITDVTGAVTEALTPAGDLTDTGTIEFTDVDLSDTHSIDPLVVASPGALGSLTASVTTDTTGTGTDGVITWNYSVAAAAVEY